MERIYADTSGGTIKLGRQGENEARAIIFDISHWQKRYGEGTASLVHRRNGDEYPYPCSVATENTDLIWVIRLADVEHDGMGECELQYIIGDQVVKSVIWSTFVSTSLTDVSDEVPDPAKSWVDQVLAASGTRKEGTGTSADSVNAHAEGAYTFAGGRGFKINEAKKTGATTGTYQLSSVEGLEEGMPYSAVLGLAANYHAGVITSIDSDNAIVTVDGYKDIARNNAEDAPGSYNVYNFLIITGRPDLGDMEVGFNAHAEGEKTCAQNKAAHAEGCNTAAIGKYSHAEGKDTIAGHGAHAEGGASKALGDLSHAEGNNTTARANNSHTEGNKTETGGNGVAPHAEGVRSKAYASGSHAEGIDSIASHDAAHAEGKETQAIGEHSHAGGYQSEAKANGSFVHGKGLLAESDYQAVFGQYNKPTTDAALIIGNGDSTAKRSNALEVTRSGDAYVQGGVYVGGSGGNKADARELATKDYVEKVVSAGAANALTDTATGEYVVIDDASPLTREIKARIQKGSSGAHVIKCYGKNLLDIDTLANNSSALSKGDGNVYTFTCKSTYVFPWYAIHIPANVPLTISFEALDSNVADNFLRVQVQTSNGKHWVTIPINAGSGRTSATITTKGNITQMQFFIDSGNGKSSYMTFKNLMLEIGASPTEYELYKGVRSYNISNDEEIAYVEPFFPTTVLIPNIAGTVVECVYNKDTKTALDESYLSKHDASGRGSFAYGDHVVATGNQAVFGEHNETNDNAALIVGNGNYDKGVQSNAFEIMKSGDAYIHGKVYFGGTGKSQGTAKEVASKESVDALATMFAGTIKETASGEAIALTDASPIEHEMGVKVHSKNLFNVYNTPTMAPNTKNVTINQVGVDDNGENYIILTTPESYTGNGSCSAVKTLKQLCPLLKVGDAVVISWNAHAELGVIANNFIYLLGTRRALNNGKSNVLTDADLNSEVVFYGGSTGGDTVTLSQFQIEIGTTATAYTPYIEDFSAVKVKKCGKNLFNIVNVVNRVNYESDGREVGIKKIENDTALQISTPSTSSGSLDQRSSTLKDLAPEIRAGKTYTLSANTTGRDAKIYLMTSKATWTFGTSRTLTDDDLNSTVLWYASGSGTTAVISNIQIEDNTGATQFEPYIEPVEYPVSADGTVEGVTLIYPTTTLMTDTAGAVMDCTYNADTKKYIDKKFAELQALILEA